MNKWILSLVIVLSPCLSYGSAYVPCSAEETANNTCFECGATCTIRYSEQQKDDNTTEKILTVSGQGAMKDYHLLGGRPWRYKGSEVTKGADLKIVIAEKASEETTTDEEDSD